MTDISKLHDLLDWKLLAGSHKWPGPDGGTCINEAAIVAAGLKYKAVSSEKDCPPCFSPVISAYLIKLNDGLPALERQKLMRFVLRLSGSADTANVEQHRLDYIVVETMRRIVASAMRAIDLPEWDAKCQAVTTPSQAAVLAAEAAEAARAARSTGAAGAAWAAGAAEAAIVDDCIAIVEGALAIGKQADPIECAVAAERMEKAKGKQAETVS